MNEAQKAALARELVPFQTLLAEVDACAYGIESTMSLTLAHPTPGAPIPAPVFGKVAKAIKTQNQMLNRLTRVLESILRGG